MKSNEEIVSELFAEFKEDLETVLDNLDKDLDKKSATATIAKYSALRKYIKDKIETLTMWKTQD